MIILFLGTYNKGEILTGPEKFSKRIAHALSDLGHQTTFICYFQDGSRYSLRKKLFGREVILDSNSERIQRLGVVHIANLLLFGNPGIVHITNFDRFAILAFLLRRIAGYKIVYTVHSVLAMEYSHYWKPASSWRTSVNIKVERVYLTNSDFVVPVSDTLAQLLETYGIRCPRQQTIHHGVDGEFLQLRRYAFGGGKCSVVFVGDYDRKEKGFGQFQAIMAGCSEDIEVFLVGSAFPKELTFTQVFRCIPRMPTDKLAQFLSDKDVYVSASRYDTFSIAALEAMASGVVPIVTKQTGMSRLITHGINGFVVEDGAFVEAAKIVTALHDNPEMLKRVSDEARKSASMTWEKAASEYAKVYATIAPAASSGIRVP